VYNNKNKHKKLKRGLITGYKLWAWNGMELFSKRKIS